MNQKNNEGKKESFPDIGAAIPYARGESKLFLHKIVQVICAFLLK